MSTHDTRYRQLFATYLRPQRARVAALAVLLGTTIILPLVNPQIVRSFIDGAIAQAPTATLLRLAGLYIGIAALIQLTGLCTNYMSVQVGWTATNQLRQDLAAQALSLDMPYHNRHTPGEMIERIDGDVTALSNFFSQFVMNVLWSVLLLAGVLALVFREDWRVGTALACFSVLTLVVFVRLRNIAIPHATALRESSAGLFGFLEERLSGVEDIRSLGAGSHVMRGFYKAGRHLHRAGVRSEKVWAGTLWSSTTGLFVIGQVMTLAMGGWLFARGQVTIGTVYLLYQYMHMLSDPIELIGEQLRDFQKAGAGARRATELLSTRPTITDGHGAPLPSGPLRVDLDDVSFGYDSEPVLEGVTFSLQAGRVLGVLGRTGSGKTTMGRLLLRLYDPQEGTVRLGGVDVRQPHLDELRSRVGFVTQDVQLFGASLRDNLTLFCGGDDDRLVEVLHDVGLGPWYATLSDGLDTHLPSGGAGLSAGEAQLLAFARVFLRDPGLVILDEASSRLDPATEHAIERAVDMLLTGRTAIVIAHRLSTVHRADDILILSDGRVVEHGQRRDLAADPSSQFAGLLHTGMEEALT